MRSVRIAIAGLLVSGCASMPDFATDWLDRLPTRKIELVTYVYPLHDARPFARPFVASIQQADAERIETAVARRITESLKARGIEVSSALSSLKSDHVWLWDWRKGPGSEPAARQLFIDSTAQRHVERVDSYATILRRQLASRPGTTVLFVCVAAHLNNRIDGVEYQLPVFLHSDGAAGLSTERCDTTASIAAVDDRLRLISYSTFHSQVGAEVLQQPASLLSNRIVFRRLTPEEWGQKIADSVLSKLRTAQ